MNKEQMAALQHRRQEAGERRFAIPPHDSVQVEIYLKDTHALMQEGERLREANAQLEAAGKVALGTARRLGEQVEEMLPIVEAMKSYATEKRYADPCVWCGEQGQSVESHLPSCPVTKACAALEQG